MERPALLVTGPPYWVPQRDALGDDIWRTDTCTQPRAQRNLHLRGRPRLLLRTRSRPQPQHKPCVRARSSPVAEIAARAIVAARFRCAPGWLSDPWGPAYVVQRGKYRTGSKTAAHDEAHHWRRGPMGVQKNQINLVIDNTEKRYLAVDGTILVDAFEGVLEDLGLANRNDPAAQVVANHLVTFAKAGERDPVRLRELTLEAVRVERRQPRSSPILPA
jgi:hypothetical protein